MRFRRHQEAARAATLRLAGLFALLVVVLVLAVNAVLALAYKLSFPVLRGYPHFFFETNTALVLLFVLGGCAVESLRLREGGAHVARLAGARPAQRSGSSAGDRLERRFANIVHEMALASRLPPPQAWVLAREDAINAFAAGWQAHDAVVTVTRGALERLTREELQGVVAHEFGHLANGDVQLNMRVVGLVWGLQMVFGLGERLAQPDERGRRGAGTVFGLALMAVGSLGWAAGRLLQAAMSRQREFGADASAVQYTRNVAGLGGALRKIAYQAAQGQDRISTPHGSSIAHLWLHASGWRWWASHPPLAERLRRLYGRPVEPLPAEPLPAPPADEPGVALQAAGPVSPSGSAEPEALRHDPLQRAAALEDREHEALDRIGRWHGAVQLRIAILALLADAGPPEAAERWSRIADGLHFAAATRSELSALGAAARREALQLLVERMAAAPSADRGLLLRQVRELGGSPALRLRRVALRARLRRPSSARLSGGRPLDSMWRELACAARAMAQALPMSGAQAAQWHDGLQRRLEAPVAASDGGTAPREALALRRLSPMDRPRVIRAAWLALPAGTADGCLEALQLACWILDTPLPAPVLPRAQ